MEKITKVIRENYGSDANFCKAMGYSSVNFPSRRKAIFNCIKKVKAFIKPLGLVLTIDQAPPEDQINNPKQTPDESNNS